VKPKREGILSFCLLVADGMDLFESDYGSVVRLCTEALLTLITCMFVFIALQTIECFASW